MAGKYNIENVLIQVRAKLLENGIKLWLPPYYVEDIGSVDAELEVSVYFFFFFLWKVIVILCWHSISSKRVFMGFFLSFSFFFFEQNLAQNMSAEIGNVPYECCLAAVNELQTNAIDKLRSNKEFQETGK